MLLPLANPVAQAELRYQQRSSAIPKRRGLLRRIIAWPFRLLVPLAVASAASVMVVEVLSGLTGFDLAVLPVEFHTVIGVIFFLIPAFVLVPITLLIHFRTQFRTLALASNTISREKRGGTWDLLLLTGMDARQIVRGKWWATVRHVWRSYVALALLRVGAVLWAVFEGGRFSMRTYPTFYFEIRENYNQPHLSPVLLAVLLISLYTLSNAIYTTAFGTLGSVFSRGSGTSLTLAMAIRTFGTIAIAVLVGVSGHLLYLHLSATFTKYDGRDYSFPWQLSRALIMGGITLFDNGAVMSTGVASYNAYYGESYSASFVGIAAGGLLGLVLYMLLTWLALRVAERVIRRQGALVPPRDWWVKMKKKQSRDKMSLGGSHYSTEDDQNA